MVTQNKKTSHSGKEEAFHECENALQPEKETVYNIKVSYEKENVMAVQPIYQPALSLVESAPQTISRQEIIEALSWVRQDLLEKVLNDRNIEALRNQVEEPIYAVLFNMGTEELARTIQEVERFLVTQWQPFTVTNVRRRKPMDWRNTPHKKEFHAWLHSLSRDDEMLFDEATEKLYCLRLAEMEALIPRLSTSEGMTEFEELFGQVVPEHLKGWLIKESRMIIDWERDYALRNGRTVRFIESLTDEEREDLANALDLYEDRDAFASGERREQFLCIVDDYNYALASANEPLISTTLDPLHVEEMLEQKQGNAGEHMATKQHDSLQEVVRESLAGLSDEEFEEIFRIRESLLIAPNTETAKVLLEKLFDLMTLEEATDFMDELSKRDSSYEKENAFIAVQPVTFNPSLSLVPNKLSETPVARFKRILPWVQNSGKLNSPQIISVLQTLTKAQFVELAVGNIEPDTVLLKLYERINRVEIPENIETLKVQDWPKQIDEFFSTIPEEEEDALSDIVIAFYDANPTGNGITWEEIKELEYQYEHLERPALDEWISTALANDPLMTAKMEALKEALEIDLFDLDSCIAPRPGAEYPPHGVQYPPGYKSWEPGQQAKHLRSLAQDYPGFRKVLRIASEHIMKEQQPIYYKVHQRVKAGEEMTAIIESLTDDELEQLRAEIRTEENKESSQES